MLFFGATIFRKKGASKILENDLILLLEDGKPYALSYPFSFQVNYSLTGLNHKGIALNYKLVFNSDRSRSLK